MVLPVKEEFESTLLALPKISTMDYTNLASWITTNTKDKMWLTDILPTTKITFTFNESVFKTKLALLTPTPDLQIASTNFFLALQDAIIVSTFLIKPGSYIGPGASTPANTWSAVTTVIPDPDSLIAAQSQASVYLAGAEYSLTTPTLANAVRKYLTLLTYTITGTSGVGTPLIAAKVKTM